MCDRGIEMVELRLWTRERYEGVLGLAAPRTTSPGRPEDVIVGDTFRGVPEGLMWDEAAATAASCARTLSRREPVLVTMC
jgi:hypothetical protein